MENITFHIQRVELALIEVPCKTTSSWGIELIVETLQWGRKFSVN